MINKSLFVVMLLLASPAAAHVTANPDNGVAGQYFETKFRVSHGCDGNATTAITLTLPKGTIVAKPQYKSGWIVEIKKSKLEKPVPAGHGKMADEQIDEIIWRGGTLPDSQYDEFGLLTKLPDTAGQTLYYPVVQTCEKGELRWDEIPAAGQQWHDLESPAPFVKIGPAMTMEHHH